MRKHLLPIVLCWALTAFAVNQSYYSSLDGKSGDLLRAALTELLYTKHTTFVSYNWDFPYDYDSNGNMLDIYSSCGYNNHNTYPTSYKCCCDAVNREHVICQSSFGGSTNNGKVPQYSDRHHLYPVDGRANGHRSDLPFGECSGGKHGTCSSKSTIIPSEGTSTCENHEYGRSGASTFSVALPSGGGSVYEVGDEYKGDIARAILYMVVRYADKAHCRLPDGAKNATTTLKTANDYPVTAWANTTRDKVGQMFSSSLSTNYGLSNYGKALLLKWHRQDPVSQKEIDRNDGVETAQGNRNPFVDYPCLVEYLWGEHAGETVSLSSLVGSWEDGFSGDGCSNSASPVIIRPTEAIDLGATSTGVSVTRSIIIQGANLTSGLTLSVGGTNASYFSLSQKSMSQSVATNGKAITITYLPSESGSHNAILQISGGGLAATHEVALTGSCCEQYNVTLYRNGQQEVISCCGTYNLPAANTEADACDGWTFRGWSTNASVNTTTTPSFVTQVNSTATLYAVYGLTEGSGDNTEYTLYSGSLVEGDYLIYYSGKVMKAKVESSRLRYNEVTPVNNVITNTDDSIIWHIAQSGDYWTIYNAKTTKYAAGTGADNKAQLNVSGTDSLSLWSASGTSTYEFVNLKNNKNNKNANLRNNGTYGFACYSTSTGGALSLYKRGTATTTYKTSPCPSHTITLAGDDGIMEGGQLFANAATAIAGTTITLEAEPEDGYSFDGWIVTKANDESTTITVTNNQFTMPEYDVTISATFTKIPTHTATWMVNGSRYHTQAGIYANESPSLPDDPDDCLATRVFCGWTMQANYSHASDAPNDLFTTAAPALTRDTTFYAVFADKETTGGTTDTTIIMETYKAISGTFGSFTFSAAKNSGSTAPTYNDGDGNKDARLYAKGTLAISNSQTMTNIVFNLSSQGKKRLAPITASVGSIVKQDSLDTTVSWTGSATAVTFTVGDNANYGSDGSTKAGQLCFTSVDIRRGATPVTRYSNYSLYCSSQEYTLTFKVKDADHASRTGHMNEVVEAVEDPTCTDFNFVGWSKFEYATNNTEAPSLNYTGRVPEGNTTYHAVFSQSTEGDGMSNNYKRVTQTSELTSGNYVVTGYNNGYFALSTGTKDKYYLAGTEVTPTNDTVKTPAASIIWNISISGDLASLSNAESGNLYIEKSGTYYNIK
ncbi:MAG: endonuclease, partial [Paludibacteraceae bacterium]|nr:endonuclease [Paludibacteraceae bacterium]